VAKANADATCPDGQDVEWGIATSRVTGTPYVSRLGRRRPASGLSKGFTTADVSATEARPPAAALRPRLSPSLDIATAEPSQSLEWSAVRESLREKTSSVGVGVAAIAA
jgi:hypothetical protein